MQEEFVDFLLVLVHDRVSEIRVRVHFTALHQPNPLFHHQFLEIDRRLDRFQQLFCTLIIQKIIRRPEVSYFGRSYGF